MISYFLFGFGIGLIVISLIAKKEFAKTLLSGAAIGVANIVPGVSGATIAVVFNIYDKFLQMLEFNPKQWKREWKFNVSLLLGMILGIAVFSKVVAFLFERFPIQTNYVFTGIVLGSIPLLWKYAVKENELQKDSDSDLNSQSEENVLNQKKSIKLPSVSSFVSFAIGLFIMLLIAFLDDGSISEGNSILPEINAKLILTLGFGGILASVAMIIPGISGSFLMLVLGIYTTIISSISTLLNFDSEFFHAFWILVPFGIGVLIGLLGGTRLIGILLKKVPNQTYSAILGLIIGSVAVIFPGFKTLVESPLLTTVYVLCTAAGFCIAYFGAKMNSNSEK